jgi:hypothetical protein
MAELDPGIYHEYESEVEDDETPGIIKPQAHWNAKHNIIINSYDLRLSSNTSMGSETETTLLSQELVLTEAHNFLILGKSKASVVNSYGCGLYLYNGATLLDDSYFWEGQGGVKQALQTQAIISLEAGTHTISLKGKSESNNTATYYKSGTSLIILQLD